jgi:hypothetical protein
MAANIIIAAMTTTTVRANLMRFIAQPPCVIATPGESLKETLSGPRPPVHRSFVLRVYRGILPTGTGGSSARKEPGRLVPGQITKVVAASDPYSAGYTRTLF